MSPYLARLLEWLDVSLQDRGILSLTSDPEAYVGTYRGLIYQLNNLSQQARKELQNLPAQWQRFKQALLHSPEKQLALRVFESQTHQNIPVRCLKIKPLLYMGHPSTVRSRNWRHSTSVNTNILSVMDYA